MSATVVNLASHRANRAQQERLNLLAKPFPAEIPVEESGKVCSDFASEWKSYFATMGFSGFDPAELDPTLFCLVIRTAHRNAQMALQRHVNYAGPDTRNEVDRYLKAILDGGDVRRFLPEKEQALLEKCLPPTPLEPVRLTLVHKTDSVR